MVARVGPVAEMILIVEDAVRFDVADSRAEGRDHIIEAAKCQRRAVGA